MRVRVHEIGYVKEGMYVKVRVYEGVRECG